ncbi:D-aminoacyl-tRNA deacylase [Rubricoccus marinus]|uniref:D-aminoacyl-tRNA deacylase n=1 Tax=Rubricoccus marinus TaxID=716817 RepID=A0A259U219_9BACT|nr:D-aminoacyl-tRNA deacylase [Rubricoccus marinus]OZC03887.1 D-tyrosyl-tRNA(Tyr) deacylase [Rubricoccus marinus]
MRALVQRVANASVTVNGEETGAIEGGLLVLLGVRTGDTAQEADWIADKIAALRVFPDETGRMNLSLADTGRDALVVSQFTLYGSLKKGTRPSFSSAAAPQEAEALYERVVARLADTLGRPVPTGRFGAHMDVRLLNDGPVTLLLEREASGAA